MKMILRTDPSVLEDDEVIIYPDVETLKEMFSYKIRPTHIHRHILAQMEIYVRENEKFMKRKNKSAALRAKKALQNITHLVKARRKEITMVTARSDFYDPDFRI